jgi:signal transduction histidine kinase
VVNVLSIRIDIETRIKEGLALAAPSRFLLLEVGDTDPEVPAADREKIFEAFFTTKDTGEGTGLGLAVSKGIVKDHDGWIEVDDRPGGGALFRVFLPVAADAAVAVGGADCDRPLLAEPRAASKD